MKMERALMKKTRNLEKLRLIRNRSSKFKGKEFTNRHPRLMLITIVRQLWAALLMIRTTLALRVAICSDAARNTHREQLFARLSPQRLGPDNGGSWYEAVPFAEPHESILDQVPVQEAITECEFANAAKCILHDSHD